MVESPRNPYDPHRPANDSALFVGREDVFAFIRQRLVTVRCPKASALIGQDGIGKTSILLQIPYQIDPRYLTAYIDLPEIRFEDAGALFVAMADAARLALETAGLSTYRLPPFPDDPTIDRWKWFSETYLDVTLSALRGRRLIFLFDETSCLLDAIDRGDVPADFGTTISALIALDERMDVIFAIDTEDEPRLETFEPLNDPMLHKRLGLLDDESARRLICEPVSAFYEVREDATEAILALAGGHPAFLQMICGLLWERSWARQHQGPITLSDVSGVIGQAITEADPVLCLAWTNSTEKERLALSAMTTLVNQSKGLPVAIEDVRLWLLREAEQVLDETALLAVMRRLEYRQILRSPSAGMYAFTSQLQHQWLMLHGDLPPAATMNKPSLRRLAIPALALLAISVIVALSLGRIAANAQTGAQPTTEITVTLDLNIVATQQSMFATQTKLAAPTDTFTPTDTYTPTDTFTPSDTFTPTYTDTPSDTPTVTLTPSITLTPTPSFTPTFTLTPPPFPTGQIHG